MLFSPFYILRQKSSGFPLGHENRALSRTSIKVRWPDTNIQKVGIPVCSKIISLVFGAYHVLCQGDIKVKLLNTTEINDTERYSEGKGHI